MKDRRNSTSVSGRRAALLTASAKQCEAQAQALWLYAGDCDRWGLGTDAAEARRQATAMRVQAVVDRALSAGLAAGQNRET